MLAQNTWARRGLYILVSMIVLAGVAVAAYGIGANQAAAGPPAGFIERGGPGNAPQGHRDSGPGNQGGQGAPSFVPRVNQDGPRFSAFANFGSRGGFSPLGLILHAMLAIFFVGLLALGAIAFFRTGGWQPQAAVAAKASPKQSSRNS